MNKTKLLIAATCMMLLLIGCNNLNNTPVINSEEKKFDGYDFEQSLYYDSDTTIKFRVSPMVQVTYIAVEMLYDETGFTNYSYSRDYIEETVEDFNDYKDHSFIKLLSSMIKNGYSYDAIPKSLYYFDESFTLRNDIELDDEILRRSGGKKNLEELIVHLRAFRRDSDFDSYFRENKEMYLDIMKQGQEMVATYEVVETIEDFYGKPLQNATITITPFTTNAYGTSITREDGSLEMTPTLHVHEDKESFLALLVHEFSHAYVNPLTSEYLDIVDKTKDLFAPIEESMIEHAYPDWEITVNEHIVRANTAIMIKDILGERAYKNELIHQRDRGFIYIDDVVESIIYYTENRDVYPTFKDYYPEIMKVFENLSDEN